MTLLFFIRKEDRAGALQPGHPRRGAQQPRRLPQPGDGAEGAEDGGGGGDGGDALGREWHGRAGRILGAEDVQLLRPASLGARGQLAGI